MLMTKVLYMIKRNMVIPVITLATHSLKLQVPDFPGITYIDLSIFCEHIVCSVIRFIRMCLPCCREIGAQFT